MQRSEKQAKPKQWKKPPAEWTTEEVAKTTLGKRVVAAAKRVAHEHDRPNPAISPSQD